MINEESGPAMLLERLRYWLGVRSNVDLEQVARDGSVARLAICFRCLATVLAFVFVGCLAVTELAWFLVVPFAVSSLSILIGNLTEKLEG